nr:hypothetical protein [Tanacetum cinerariifolium]
KEFALLVKIILSQRCINASQSVTASQSRVQRLEKELKARTPIHKVDRGRSKPVMAWVPKKV